jgi:DNA repair exonuclease SbcCD ATPase subunit
VGIFDKQIDAAVGAAFAKHVGRLNDSAKELESRIEELKAERDAIAAERDAARRLKTLQEQISRLEIDKAKIVEENARDKREVTHMVGLERKRQEFEAEQARKEIATARAQAVLEVREENLAQERKAFEEHMRFQNDRFTAEVGYLKELMGDILDRLPTVTVDRKISDRTTTTKPTA